MNFDCRLGDTEPVGNHLVGLPLYEALQNLPFTSKAVYQQESDPISLDTELA